MRTRLLTAMLLTATLAVLGFGVPLAIAVRALYRDEALLTISEEAAEAVGAVPGSFATTGDPPELPEPEPHVRVALYDIEGHRLQGDGPERADTTVQAVIRNQTLQRDREALVVAHPVLNEESLVGVVRTSLPASVVARRTYRTWAAMAGLAVAVVGGAGLLSARRSRTLTRPLGDLRSDAEVLGAGALIPPRAPSGIIEIDTVHEALVDAATNLNEALAREGALSADLAHQVRTPLASLRLRVETEQRDTNHDASFVADLLRDLDRLEQTTDDVLALARDIRPARAPHSLATSVRETAQHWRPRFERVGRALEVHTDDELPWVHASPSAIRQILDVLVDNGLSHGQGTVQIAATRVGDGAVIAVSDQGHTTIDPHTVFTRRSAAARGNGIGLPLARRLAEAESLRLVVANAGPGVAFHLVVGASAANGRPPEAGVDR